MNQPAKIPAHVQRFVDVLGVDLTVKFLLELGGSPIYLPENTTHSTTLNGHDCSLLVNTVGREMALALGKEFGRGLIEVPLAKPFVANHLFRAGAEILEIARLLHVSAVSVRRWVPASVRSAKKAIRDDERIAAMLDAKKRRPVGMVANDDEEGDLDQSQAFAP